jgi:hypothetical protein
MANAAAQGRQRGEDGGMTIRKPRLAKQGGGKRRLFAAIFARSVASVSPGRTMGNTAVPAGLLLKMDVRELLPVAVPHDEAGVVVFLDRPGRREAARGQ